MLRLITCWTILGTLAMVQPTAPPELHTFTQGKWRGVQLHAPNAGALALTVADGGAACDTGHRSLLTALGMKPADKTKVALDCPANVAIFRQRAAMVMLDFGTLAHLASTPLPVTPPRVADVKFVIATPCIDEHQLARPPFDCATGHLDNAERVYDEQMTGITFPAATTPGLFTNRIGATEAADLAVNCDTDNIARIRALSPTSPTRITVYYVGESGGTQGVTCENGEIIIVSSSPGSMTLAHEFGHAFAFSLEHLAPMVGAKMDTRRLMGEGAPRGELLTLGESLRFNVNKDSPLNKQTPPPPYPLRNCDDPVTTKCPPAVLGSGS